MKELTKECIQDIRDFLKETTNLAKKEAPLAIKELVKWEIVNGIIGAITSFVLWVLLTWGSYRLIILGQNLDSNLGPHADSGGYYAGGVLLGILAIVGVLWFLDNLTQILKFKIAPRIGILEYLANLTRTETKK